ncbi:MAG: hypothetical protein ABS918_06020 [Saccharopolyspora rectivirgula]
MRELKAASFVMDYTAYAQEAVASAETLMVPYDLQARRPRRLLPEEREFLAEWQLEQVTPERSRA